MLQVRPPRRGLLAPGAREEPTKGAVAPWQDLPPELLGLLLLRLPSLADRVRLRAVCPPWRSGGGAQRHPLPPPLPWLAFRDGGLVDLDDAPVRCAHILRDGVFGYLAVDNLAFLVHDDGACSLMNPLTGLTIPLPKLAPALRQAIDEYEGYDQSYIRNVHKPVLSSPLGLMPDILIAVLISPGLSIAISACNEHDAINISIPDPESTWGRQIINDIAFLHGKLYALTQHEGLHAIEVDAARLGELKSSPGFHQCIADGPKQKMIYNDDSVTDDPSYMVLRYLAESNGRMLMVRRWMSFPHNTICLEDPARTFRFEIFEADLATAPGQWTEVDSLGGQALFLSSECSKSVLASQCPGGIQEDCIYFMHRIFDNPSTEYLGTSVDPLADSGVYNMRDGKIMPLLPEAVMARLRSKQQFLTWFFPVDA